MISFLILIIVGGIAGWLAGVVMRGSGFGLVGNIFIGVVGALLAGFLLKMLAMVAIGLIGTVLAAAGGAFVLLFLVRLFGK
ncbi:GlsB/YeaQ/YmgE family stress response membrane protein [Aminivibrio sp.]